MSFYDQLNQLSNNINNSKTEEKAKSVMEATDRKASENSGLTVDEFYDNLVGERYSNITGVDRSKSKYGEISRSDLENEGMNRTALEHIVFNEGLSGGEIVSNRSRARNELNRDIKKVEDSSAFERIDDTVRGFSDSVVNGLLGIGSIAGVGIDQTAELLGLPNPRLTDNVAYTSDKYNKWSQETEREGKKAERKINQSRDKMRDRDIEASNVSTAGKVMDQFVEASKNIMTNPYELVDVIANATGSLVPIAAVGRLSKAANLGDEAIFGITMLMNGVLESGSAINEVVGTLYDASEKDLMEKSPEYKERREAGMTDQEARQSMVSVMAPETFLRIAPYATAVSALNAKFESDPLNVLHGGKSLFKQSLTEGLEEGLQEGESSIVTGLAEKNWIDKNKNIYESLGSDIAQGVLGGIGMPAVTNPGALIKPTAKVSWETAKLPFTLSGAIISKSTSTIAGKVKEENSKESPVSMESNAKSVKEAVDNANVTKDNIDAEAKYKEDIGEELSYDPEVVKSSIDEITEVMESGKDLANFLIEDPNLPDSLKGNLSNADTMADVFIAINDTVNAPETSTEDKIKLAGLAINVSRRMEEMLNDKESILSTIPNDSNTYALLDAYISALDLFKQIPEIKQRQENLNNYLNNIEAPEINEESINNGTIDANVDITLAKAELNPDSVNAENTAKILEYADAGLIDLSPQQEIKLRSLNALLQAEKTNQGNKEDSKSNRSSRSIRLQAESKNSETMPSAREMVKDIYNSIISGDIEYAEHIGKNLSNFAKHFNNKIDALNRSIKSGKKEPYNALSKKDGDNAWYTSKPGIIVHPNNENSKSFANSVFEDGSFVIDLNNRISEAFPELNIPLVTPIELDKSIRSNSKTTNTKSNKETTKNSKEPLDFTIEKSQKESNTPKRKFNIITNKEAIRRLKEYSKNKIEKGTKEAFGTFYKGFQEYVTYIPKPKMNTSEEVMNAWMEENIKLNEYYEERKKELKNKKEESKKKEETKKEPKAEEKPAETTTKEEEVSKEEVTKPTNVVERFAKGIEAFGINPGNLFKVFTTKNKDGENSYDKEAQSKFVNKTIEEFNESSKLLDDMNLAETDKEVMLNFLMAQSILNNLSKEAKSNLSKDVKDRGNLRPLFPNVVGSNQNLPKRMNALIRGFITNIRTNSRLYNNKKPFLSVLYTLTGKNLLGAKDKDISNIQDKTKLVNSLKDRMGEILNNTEKSIIGKLNELNTKLKDSKNPINLVEALKNPESFPKDSTIPYRWSNGRILNILEVSPNGEISLNPEIMEISSLATIQFLNDITEFISESTIENVDLSNLSEEIINSEGFLETVRKLIGNDKVVITKISGDFKAIASNGLETIESSVMEALSTKISQYLGYVENPNVGIGINKGLITAIAGEFLDALVSSGYLDQKKINVTYKINDKSHNMTLINYEVNSKAYNRDIMNNKEILDKIILKERNPNYAFDLEDLNTDNNFKQGDFENPLIDSQVEAKKILSEVPFHENNIFNELITLTGREGLADFLYPMDKDSEGKYNINHLNTISGQRMTIIGAFNQYDEMSANIKNSKGEDATLANQQVYFGNKITRENRYHYLGGYNPQNNGLLRNLLTIKTSNRQSVNSSPKNKKLYELALAQALGIKVNNLMPAEYTKELYEMLDQTDRAMNILVEAAEGTRTSIGEGDLRVIREDMEKAGMDINETSIHALFDYAKYIVSESNGTEHISNLYVEADGITSGTINAMMILGGDLSDSSFRNTLAMGGIFFGDVAGMTNNEYRSTISPMDIYRKVGLNPLEKNEGGFKLREVKSVVGTVVNSTFGLLSKMIPGVSLGDDGSLNIGRTGKGDVTTSVYGSGVDSMALNTLKDITDSMYEKFSNLIQYGSDWREYLNVGFFNDPTMSKSDALTQFWSIVNDINHMASFDVVGYRQALNDARGSFVDPSTFYKDAGFKEVFKNPDFSTLTFDLYGREFKNVTNNIRTYYSSEIKKSISDVISDRISHNLSTVQKISNILSNIGIEFFDGIIKEEVKKSKEDPNNLPNDFISQNTIDEANRLVGKLVPKMVNNKGRTSIYKTDKVTLNDKSNIGSTLDDKHRMSYEITSPIEPGVSALPFYVIGNGDASHVTNSLLHNTHAKEALYTHDGIETHIELTEQNSYEVNREISRSWGDNSFTGMYNSLLGTINNLVTNKDKLPVSIYRSVENSLSGIDHEVFLSYIKGDPDTMTDLEYKNGVIDFLTNYLLVSANHIQSSAYANSEMMKLVKVSIDHNASANNAYYQEGIDANSTEFLERYNEFKEKKYEELSNNSKLLSEGKKGRYEQLGEVSTPNGVSTLSMKEDRNINNVETIEEPITQESKGITEELSNENNIEESNIRELSLDQIISELDGDSTDKAIITSLSKLDGVKEVTIEIGSHKELSNKYSSIGYSNNTNGFFDIENNKIVIRDTSNISEVLAHELIHKATYNIVNSFYENGQYSGNNSKNINKAIKELESLKEQFQLRYENEDIIDPSTQKLLSILNSNKSDAEKLNEFMAWGLTNKDIASNLRNSKREDSKFINRVINKITDFMSTILNTFKINKKDLTSFDNLVFNTMYLAENQSNSSSKNTSKLRSLFSESVDSTNNKNVKDILNKSMRIIDLNNKSIPTNDRIGRSNRVNDHKRLLVRIENNINSLVHAGFNLNNGEKQAIRAMSYMMGTNAQLNSSSIQDAQKVYSEVLTNLTVEDFMANPNSNNPADYYRASSMFDVIHGRGNTYTDKFGRNSVLSTFIALGSVSPEFRKILSNIDIKSRKTKGNTLDSRVGAIGNNSMNMLNNFLSGYKDSKTAQIIIDGLVNKMLDSGTKDKSVISKGIDTASSIINKTNDGIAKTINKTTTKIYDKSVEATKSNNKLVKALGVIGSISGVLSEDRSGVLAESVGVVTNRGEFSKTIRELFTDFIGMTSVNKNVIKLTKLIKANIQLKRQEYREDLPRLLSEKFKKPLTDEQWNTLTNVVSKIDIASLIQSNKDTASTILSKIKNDRTLQRRINDLESELNKADRFNWFLIDKKANELVEYMSSGIVSSNLLRNANTIANLNGEDKNGKLVIANSLDLTNKLDELITLRALTKADRSQLQELRQLLESEPEGMNTLINYIKTQNDVDSTRIGSNSITKANSLKGYTASIFSGKGSVIIANDSDHAKLKEMSYVRIGDYKGTFGTGIRSRKGYYYSNVTTNPPFHQGIMQNIRNSAGGIDSISGMSDSFNAGMITDPREVRKIFTALKNNPSNSVEGLIPIYKKTGDLIPIAYEMTVDPKMLSNLEYETRLNYLVGARSGRTFEESVAEIANKELIDKMYSMMEEDYHLQPDSYINIFDQKELDKDPVLKVAISLIPDTYKQYMLEKGQGEFLVRRDVLNDAFGYRMATIGDAWTGNSRWNDKVLNEVKNLSMSIMGNKAYERLMSVQSTTQNLVQSARNIIVVKSMIVPAVNLVSNIIQSLARGISINTLSRDLPIKLNEINNYVDGRKRLMQLELELSASPNDLNKVSKIKAEIKTIESTIKRLSIYPLIEAGEFTSISESLIDNNTTSLVNGKWDDYFESIVDKMPKSMRNLGKYIVISKDTALYKGLQKSVDYGDFLTKAIYYDHLINKKGMDKTTALEKVSEEYVNYDRLQGRTRHTLENIGMLWFYNWKIRATKIGMSLIRNNPLTTFMSSLIPMPDALGSVGIPTDDALIFKLLNGESLWGTIGPGMGLRSPSLNPWYNMLN